MREGSDLVVAARSFEDFYLKDYQAVVGLAYALSGNRWLAEDLAQEAFLAAHRNWPRVSAYDQPGAWVRRVAINEAISVSRRSSRERRVVQRLATMAAAPTGVVADPVATIDDEGMWAAVRALPQDQAAAIALRYGADLSVEDTAETLRVTVPAAKSLLHRARTALRSSPAIQP